MYNKNKGVVWSVCAVRPVMRWQVSPRGLTRSTLLTSTSYAKKKVSVLYQNILGNVHCGSELLIVTRLSIHSLL